MNKRKPPSRIRYEIEHPVVSARLSMEDYMRLQELKKKRGVSLAQLIREAIGSAERDYEQAYRAGYEKGYEDGRRMGRIEMLIEIIWSRRRE